MDDEKLFIGEYHVWTHHVWYCGVPLSLFLEEVDHSPTGFNWGYGGSGPAQLAYAILRTAIRESIADDREAKFWAKQLYQKFKWDIVAGFTKDKRFELSLDKVNAWIFANRELAQKAWEAYGKDLG